MRQEQNVGRQNAQEQNAGQEVGMGQERKEEQLRRAIETLHEFVLSLTAQAGKGADYGEKLWQDIRQSQGLLQEMAYYHDSGQVLCRYQVAGYTLADVLIWQVDHFKLYMDRPDEMNRYRQQRLILEAFEVMAEMEKAPEKYIDKMRYESGQDAANG